MSECVFARCHTYPLCPLSSILYISYDLQIITALKILFESENPFIDKYTHTKILIHALTFKGVFPYWHSTAEKLTVYFLFPLHFLRMCVYTHSVSYTQNLFVHPSCGEFQDRHILVKGQWRMPKLMLL